MKTVFRWLIGFVAVRILQTIALWVETWHEPFTASASATITSSSANETRDNLNFLYHRPAARVYNSAAQSIPHNTLTTITFDSERFDNAGIHSTSLNTDRLTAPVSGVYIISVSISWATGANDRYVGIYHNGSTPVAAEEELDIGGDTCTQTLTTPYFLSSGDYVNVQVVQDSGGALNIDANSNYSPEFSMVMVSSGSNS